MFLFWGMFYVYVLVNPQGKIYIGQTSDLQKRLKQHNDPDCKLTLYTKRNPGPWKLAYYEVYETRAMAVRREKQLKSGKGRAWLHKEILKDRAPGC